MGPCPPNQGLPFRMHQSSPFIQQSLKKFQGREKKVAILLMSSCLKVLARICLPRLKIHHKEREGKGKGKEKREGEGMGETQLLFQTTLSAES